MKATKIYLSLLIALSFLFVGIGFVHAVDSVPSVESSTLATVNIANAKIIYQEGNTLKISFDLTNREGLQTGVKYAVMLVSEIDQKQYVIDEKVFDESLTLQQNSTLEKEISYTAQNVPSGNYIVLVKSSNANGFPFGIAEAGKANITGNLAIEIINETCGIDLTGKNTDPSLLLKGIDINQNQNIHLNCTAKNTTNKTITVIPEYITNYRSEFGDVIEANGGDNKSITFAPLEKKDFSLVLPKVATSQVYNVSVNLKNTDISSNTVSTHYFTQGKSVTIVNVSFDNDYYKKGDTANLTLVLSSIASSDNRLSLSMTNTDGKDCIAPIDKALLNDTNTPKIELPIPVINNCLNPHAIVKVLDNAGNVLDQKAFIVQTTSTHTTSNTLNKILLVVLLIVIMCIVYIFLSRKNKKGNISGPSISILIFIFGISFCFIPTNVVKADTFSIGTNNDIFVTASLNKTKYAPGENIIITGISIYSGSANTDLVSLLGTTTGNSILTLISSSGISQGTTVYGNDATLVAPANSGTVNFTAGIDQPAASLYSGGVSSQPVAGGTNDTNIVCYAGISTASINGDNASYKYVYTFNGGSPTNGSCSLTIPKGQSSVSDDPGLEIYGPSGYGVNITSYCFDKANSTVINNAGISNCP